MNKIAPALLCLGLVAAGLWSESKGGDPLWIWIGAVIAFFSAFFG